MAILHSALCSVCVCVLCTVLFWRFDGVVCAGCGCSCLHSRVSIG